MLSCASGRPDALRSDAVRTVGVDLSADPAKTAVCEIDWAAETVELLARPVTDAAIVAAVTGADLAGVDVPLGWPDGFVEAVSAHHHQRGWPPVGTEPPLDRVPLRYRRTDAAVVAEGQQPLSVSTDRIGVAAMRGARIQALLVEAGVSVDRSGVGGRVAEVYPAAALRTWGLTHRGYKGRRNRAVCRGLAADLASRCGRLSGAVAAALDDADDDDVDAVVCALIARAVIARRTTGPSPDDVEAARREGWIHVPAVAPERIVGLDTGTGPAAVTRER